jgi:hypothetical protein
MQSVVTMLEGNFWLATKLKGTNLIEHNSWAELGRNQIEGMIVVAMWEFSLLENLTSTSN